MTARSSALPSPPAPPTALSGTLPFGLPAAWYGARLWLSVCLALYAAFWLRLDDPYWAATTAGIVCQPAVGASLRKGWFRVIGTIIGAVAIVVMTALFPQSRVGLMASLAIWSGVSAVAATLLRNFASYAAALAGYTAAIIAADTLGATGGASDAVFLLALSRTTEILLGIACASLVLGLTDAGGARRRLGMLLGTFSAEIACGLRRALEPGGNAEAGRPARRDLLRRAGGFGVVLDQAAGEISSLPFRPRLLRTAVEGLYGALSAWRLVATHLEHRPGEAGRAAVAAMRDLVPPPLARAGADPAAAARSALLERPLELRRACLAAARRLVRLPADTPSERLLADGVAEALLGLGRALAGSALLHHGRVVAPPPRPARPHVPDWLPPIIAGLRACATIALAELAWVLTGWPNGGGMVLFAAVTVILFAPREDAAFRLALGFLGGTAVTTVLAAIVAFAVLPLQASFAQLCLALGFVLVPAGALSALAWQQAFFVALAVNFIPLLGPTNRMSYDPGAFYNTAVALLAGVALAALMMRLIPPLSPGLRARRLLTLTLRDLRRLARTGGAAVTRAAWERRVHARLSAMPAGTESVQLARLMTAMFVGSELLRLRQLAARLGAAAILEPALARLRDGDSRGAAMRLRDFSRWLDQHPADPALRRQRLRAQGGGLAIAEALAVHGAYFDAELDDP